MLHNGDLKNFEIVTWETWRQWMQEMLQIPEKYWNEFVASKISEFYSIGITKLVSRLPKVHWLQWSLFWLIKFCLSRDMCIWI